MFIHNLHEETKSYLKLLLNERRQSAPVSSTGGDKAKKDKKKDEEGKTEDKPEGLPVGAVVELSPTQDFEAMGAQYGVGQGDLEKAKRANRQLRGAGPSEFYGDKDENAAAQYGASESDMPTGKGIGFHPKIVDITNRDWLANTDTEGKKLKFSADTSNPDVLFGPSRENIKTFNQAVQPYKDLQFIKAKRAILSNLPLNAGQYLMGIQALGDIASAGLDFEPDMAGSPSAQRQIAQQAAQKTSARNKKIALKYDLNKFKTGQTATQGTATVPLYNKDAIVKTLKQFEPQNSQIFDELKRIDKDNAANGIHSNNVEKYYEATRSQILSDSSTGALSGAIKTATQKLKGMGGLDPFYAEELAAKLMGGEWIETMAKDLAPAQQRGVLSSMGSPTAVLGR